MDKKANLNPQTTSLIKNYGSLLKKEGINFRRLILFGSFAKGRTRPWSDIDVCLTFNRVADAKRKDASYFNFLASRLNPRLEIIPMTEKSLKNKYDPLASEIRKHGLEIR